MALNTFYDEIVGLADSFAEAYQGRHGLIGQIAVPANKKAANIIEFLQSRWCALRCCAACSRPFYYNFTDLRGFSWANGEYRTTLYNHARQPNGAALDCLSALMTTPDKSRMYAGYGWRTARSRHTGGVVVGMADGAVRFILTPVLEIRPPQGGPMRTDDIWVPADRAGLEVEFNDSHTPGEWSALDVFLTQ
jgi:hypothetical protein